MKRLLGSRGMERTMWIVWPAFLAAIAAEIAFFAMFDPLDFNMRFALSREAVYTAGFVAFWLLGMLSSTLTLFLSDSAADDADGDNPFA